MPSENASYIKKLERNVDSTQAQRALAGLAAILLSFGAAEAADGPLRALHWLAPGADRPHAIGLRPAECLMRPPDPRTGYFIEVGRAAFRTPLLLGGQAARAGVACETCHKGGHTNPDFLFPGVSGAPGTADVTSSLFSSHRGDGVDNPVAIPDLGEPKARLKVAQDQHSRALETFIHGLITQEFDGPEPSPVVLDGLAAYVRSLSPDACPRNPVEPIRAASYISDARRAVAAARRALKLGDRPTAIMMVSAARSPLGLLYERYDVPALARDRVSLRAADSELMAAAEAIRQGDPKAERRLTIWTGRSLGWGSQLQRDEPKSLFDRKRLAGL